MWNSPSRSKLTGLFRSSQSACKSVTHAVFMCGMTCQAFMSQRNKERDKNGTTQLLNLLGIHMAFQLLLLCIYLYYLTKEFDDTCCQCSDHRDSVAEKSLTCSKVDRKIIQSLRFIISACGVIHLTSCFLLGLEVETIFVLIYPFFSEICTGPKSFTWLTCLTTYCCFLVLGTEPLVKYMIHTLHWNQSCLLAIEESMSFYEKPSGFIHFLPLFMLYSWRNFQIQIFQEGVAQWRRNTQDKNVLLDTVLNSLPGIVCVYDKNLTIRYMKGLGLRKYGRVGSFVGMNMKDFTEQVLYLKDESLIKEKIARFQRALSGEEMSYNSRIQISNSDVEFAAYHTSLEPIRDSTGEIVGVTAMSLDTTELIVVQEALTVSEKNYRTLIESIDDVIMKINDTKSILFVNRDFMNFNRETIAGRSLFDILGQNQRDEISIKLGNLFKNKEHFSWEWGNLVQGEQKHFSSRVVPIVSDSSSAECAIVITSDITQKKRVLEQEREVNEMRIASKSKTAFICEMSHEIRNPLNIVMGSLHLLASTKGLNKTQLDYLNDANENVKLLLAIVSDVLDISKVEAGKLQITEESASVLDIVETTANMIQSQAYEKGLSLFTHVDCRIPYRVRCDRFRISQILLNFLGNSLKFTNRGYICLTAELVSETETEAEIKFTCKDTGFGIKDEDKDKIFESFYQVKEQTQPQKYAGWGLGCAICVRLADLMNGHVGLNSHYGEGSEFHFTISLPKLSNVTSARVTRIEEELALSDYSTVFVLNCETIDASQQFMVDYLKKLGVSNISIPPKETGTYGDTSSIECYARNHASESIAVIADGCHYNELDHILSKFSNVKLLLLQQPQNDAQDIALTSPRAVTLSLPIRLNRLMCALTNSEHSELNSLNRDLDVKCLSLNSTAENQPCRKNSKSFNFDVEVLCVEDNMINRKILCNMLHNLGVRKVDVAVNGLKGLNKVKEKKEPYSIIFMDLMMDTMDGIECTKEIRELAGEKAHTPIVACTANVDIQSISKVLSHSFDKVITKPISAEKLLKTLQQYCV